jgi:hypothetical protein
MDDLTLTRAGDVFGSLAWMAPEQAAGEWQRVDALSDVHALGAILFFLAAGEPVFAPEMPVAAEDNPGMVDLADADALEEGMGKHGAAEGNLGMVDVEKACDRSRDSSFQHGQRGCKDPMALIHLDTGEEVDVRDSSRWHYDEDVALLLEEAEDASSPFRKSWALHPREAAFSPGLARISS